MRTQFVRAIALQILVLSVVVAGGWADDGIPQPQLVVPDAFVRLGPGLVPLGPVQTYRGDGGIADADWLIYDCLVEPYVIPGLRPGAVDDFTVLSDAEGEVAERMEVAWVWNPPAGPETCWVLVATAESFDDTCTGPPYSGDYGGWWLGFSDLPAGTWYTDTGDSHIRWDMPRDGSGAVHLAIARYFWPEGFEIGPGAPLVAHNPLGGPGSTEPTIWFDDFPPDGEFTAPTECYTLGEARVGLAIRFYATPYTGWACDANCDKVIDSADIQAFFTGLSDPDQWHRDYPSCNYLHCFDINVDGAVDGGDIQPFFRAMSVGYCPAD